MIQPAFDKLLADFPHLVARSFGAPRSYGWWVGQIMKATNAQVSPADAYAVVEDYFDCAANSPALNSTAVGGAA